MNTARIIRELIICLLLLLSIFFIQAQPKYYGGAHHTSTHTNTYVASTGSTPKGDHTQDSSTYNRYGIHASRRKK